MGGSVAACYFRPPLGDGRGSRLSSFHPSSSSLSTHCPPLWACTNDIYTEGREGLAKIDKRKGGCVNLLLKGGSQIFIRRRKYMNPFSRPHHPISFPAARTTETNGIQAVENRGRARAAAASKRVERVGEGGTDGRRWGRKAVLEVAPLLRDVVRIKACGDDSQSQGLGRTTHMGNEEAAQV